jgi:hypothetical protein
MNYLRDKLNFPNQGESSLIKIFFEPQQPKSIRQILYHSGMVFIFLDRNQFQFE